MSRDVATVLELCRFLNCVIAYALCVYAVQYLFPPLPPPD